MKLELSVGVLIHHIHSSALGVFNHTDKSFLLVLHDPSADKLPLHSSFFHVLAANDIQLQPLNIQTSSGLSWKVELEVGDGYFFFTKGWKNISTQLFLTEGCILVFDYIRKQTLNMTFYHRNQSRTMGTSFFHVFRDPLRGYLEFPNTFSQVNFGKQAPKQPVILFASETKSWSVTDEAVNGKLRFTKGWLNFVQDLSLKQKQFVVFTCVDTNTMKVTTFDESGMQILIHDTDRRMDVENAPNEKRIDKEIEIQHPDEEEYAFTGKVTRRLRFHKKLENIANVAHRKQMKVMYAGTQMKLLDVGQEKNVGYKRYVLRGWPEFLKEHGISFGEVCSFRHVTVRIPISLMQPKHSICLPACCTKSEDKVQRQSLKNKV